MSFVHPELRDMAKDRLRSERGSATLHPTALVNEAFLRIATGARVSLERRAHFFWFVSESMRRILVEHARTRATQKRGNGRSQVSLDEDRNLPSFTPSVGPNTTLALEAALSNLEAVDSRAAQVVRLRFYGGLEHEEVAEALGVSPSTVKREWRMARVWLARELSR